MCSAAPVAPATVAAEQAGRARFGSALARNPSLDLQPAAAAALEAGIVDPRVVLVLADLASPRRLAIADFPVAPFEPPYALRRRVLLTSVDGHARLGRPAAAAAHVAGQPASPVRPELGRGSGPRTAHRLPRTHPDRPAHRLTPAPEDHR